ncbi:dTDP-4-dehydrorhamnose 3,5-epimerase family protein [Streptomyces chryseus]|uniref:dTDP-4-dehydrorhamnose 3,5-epimerase family protein n=1 Tax=Streptomyces chryseus TaxID=68186 RepID=UPI00110FD850|nr:dTDP-4-dehydrorhamnose 3,5-epimerase family protein [Streptomyces chryseus]GGX45164.1 dTDP-4-dehydrorhamnose 3,5-epimerase [Streptomyces chryseus]
MRITETAVPDAYRIDPDLLPDHRGRFYEGLRYETLRAATGHAFELRQVNFTVSHRNALRGIHGTTMPPGQGKIISCVRGAALTMVVDLRLGSPAFGQHDVLRQDPDSATALYLPDGLGLAYVALADDTCMNYLCDREYVHGTIIDVDAFDPALGLPWNLDEPVVRSARDAAAPTLAEAVAGGTLPAYEQCRRSYRVPQAPAP